MNSLSRDYSKPGSFGLIFLFSLLLFVVMRWTSFDGLTLLAGILSLALFLFLFLFKKELLVNALFFCLPLSILAEVPGTQSTISIPSEAIVLLLIPATLFIFSKRKVLDKRILKHPLTILIFIEIGWLLLSSLFSSHHLVSFKRLFIKSCFVLFYFFILAHWLKDRKNWIKPFIYFALGCLPIILYSIIKHASWNFMPAISATMPQPFFADHTIYGAVLVFLLPFTALIALKKREDNSSPLVKLILIIASLIILTGTVFSFSRSSIIALGSILLIYGLMRLGAGFKLVSSLLLVGGVALYLVFSARFVHHESGNSSEGIISALATKLQEDNSSMERINRWNTAILMFKERPITGFGPGTYQFKYGDFQDRGLTTNLSTSIGDRGNAHSEYLGILAETGFPGFLIFLFICFYALYLGFKVFSKSSGSFDAVISQIIVLAFITFLINSLFNSFLDQDKMAALVYSALALLVVIDIRDRSEKMNADSLGVDG